VLHGPYASKRLENPGDNKRRRYRVYHSPGKWRAHAIEAADGDTLFDLFTRTRTIRRGIVAIGQDSEAPDFGRPRPSLAPTPLPRPYALENE